MLRAHLSHWQFSVLSDPGPIEPFLADVKTRVDWHLTRFFEQKREHAQSLSEPSKELVEALFDFTMRGGKRTRPAVLVAGHMAVAHASTTWKHCLIPVRAWSCSRATCSVHDDWMDQDDERRGGPTAAQGVRGAHRQPSSRREPLGVGGRPGQRLRHRAGGRGHHARVPARRRDAGVLGDAAGRGLGAGARSDRLSATWP